MKNLSLLLIIISFILSCKSPKASKTSKINPDITEVQNDTVRIANDEVEYEIIIFEPGFNAWLQSIAQPVGYYSQEFMESRNNLFVIAWNQRVLQPNLYDPNLYQFPINYQQDVDYGYEVNYKLYNYFIYFQLRYEQQLTGFKPRI